MVGPGVALLRLAGVVAVAVLTAGSALAAPVLAGEASALTLQPCWLRGHPHAARCGAIRRPLDPTQAQGQQIEVQVAVVPALARNPLPDPVFFFAGGPGQSAIDLAGPLAARFARLGNRRDLVFIDQRGTGRSAPLRCADDSEAAAWQPLPDDSQRQARLQACLSALQVLPQGDLRQFTTDIAMADVDAVRSALGAQRINLIGFSYGTRAALAYQRAYAQHVRRSVLDGVVPPWLALPSTVSADNQAALDAVFDGCERSPTCGTRYPGLRQQWRQLLASLPRQVQVGHPLTGEAQSLRLSRDTLLSLVRGPLYAPALAAALPQAMAAAAQGRIAPMVGLSSALGVGGGIASGMHFSVVCAEDRPQAAAPVGAARPADAASAGQGTDFGDSFARLYQEACAAWPRAAVASAFYTLPPAQSPVLLVSGGADPVTPPRHAAAATLALGKLARHVVVANAGHGVLALACLREAAMRFISAPDDASALDTTGLDCAADLPRAPDWSAPGAPQAGPTGSASATPSRTGPR